MRACTRHPSPRGAALLEAMIGLSVLVVGLLGMMQLQIYGMGANRGARAKMRAGFLANDLAAQLRALPILQPSGIPTPELVADVAAAANACPTPFGYLLVPGTATIQSVLAAHDGTNTSNLGSMPSIYPDALIERDPQTPALPLYQRRWSVCDYTPPGSGVSPAKLIAASVIYRESASTPLREVVVYTEVFNAANLAQNLTAYR